MKFNPEMNHQNTSQRALSYAVPLSLVLVLSVQMLPLFAQDNLRETALTCEQQGSVTDAVSAWKTLAGKQQSNPEPWAHLGLLEARQEHYSNAIAYYRRAMRLRPAMPGLRLNLGLALFKAGQNEQAIEILSPLLTAQPDDQRLTILIGMAHNGLGEYPAAVDYLRQASVRDPDNLQLLLALGHNCLSAKQFQCVVDMYHRILALNAESAEADMLGGEALDEMKDTIGATQEFRAAVRANPNEPNVHFGLGYLLWTQRQFEEAAQEFHAELDNDPDHFEATLYLADADMQLSHAAEARPLLEKLAKVNPTVSMVHLDLGMVYSESGQVSDAIRELQAAAKLAPKDVNPHWRLGRLYRSLGEMKQAKTELDIARNLNKVENDGLLDVMSNATSKRKGPHIAGLTPNAK
jgi:tetratricopeptide (TPR) repeat protein